MFLSYIHIYNYANFAGKNKNKQINIYPFIMNKLKATIIAFALTICATPLIAQNQKATQVLNTLRSTNSYFMKKYADPTLPTFVKRERPSSLWTRGVYYEGLMALNEIDPQQSYIAYTDRWASFHKWTPRNGVKTTHADDQCCTQTYLMRYETTKDDVMKKFVIEDFDNQIATGRIDYWTWIDAIQMAMPAYAHLYKITGERKYIDVAMKMYNWSRNECGGGCYNAKEGLWWRDKDFVPPYKEQDGNNCYWSRGNGWVYVALCRVMDQLSPKDKYYKQLKKDFIAMSMALAKIQREDGFWNVSLVSPTTFGGKETTGTSLFLAGMSWGIRHGILAAKTYRPIVDKAWNGMETYAVHPNGFLGYVQGTGKEPKDGQPVTYTKVPDFEDFGLGCFLLGGVEYYKLLTSGK